MWIEIIIGYWQPVLGVVAADLSSFHIDDLAGKFKIRIFQLLKIRQALKGKNDEKEDHSSHETKSRYPELLAV
ncbi:hypothetical protein D3C83_146340 [compost metagenome]